LNFIKKRWEKQSPNLKDDEQKKLLENMNKGDAAAIITRLRNGSQVREFPLHTRYEI